jgi:SAM-dependent methyltransferase
MGQMTGKTDPSGASYDTVGRYRQDAVNGFSRALIDTFLEIAALERAGTVLDAMAGDGNLTLRLRAFCRSRGLAIPRTTVLEYSRVQAEFAKKALAGTDAEIVWGDVLTMKDRGEGREIPAGAFDRILIKSSNHEIPRGEQARLYGSLFRTLRPRGLFVNLGFLFGDAAERDELREVAKVKDAFAGMTEAVRNRHFLTRDELYGCLRTAGFIELRGAARCDYVIRSRVVAEQYFPEAVRREADLEHQAAQLRALTLRKNGRITFKGTGSVMRLPGEITVARKPGLADENARIFEEYPMDFLRHVHAHAAMLEEASLHVPRGAEILDIGCGIGLLTEHLHQDGLRYTGIDLSPDFIAVCRRRYGGREGFAFEVADAGAADLGSGRYDAVTLLNTLNLPGLDAVALLSRVHAALKPGGRLVVSGPSSPASFSRIEEQVLAQLKEDGRFEGYGEAIQALREANRRLLTERGNYWSVEGMVELLKHLGYGRIHAATNGLYYGASYLVVAGR